ncbi:MAG: hypothetical protein LBN23_00490, partial [Paludibacter sp.]|nr:hypothetical protein [Paludibacter sp.]
MKKILFTIIFIAATLAATAQPRAIGVRLGWANEITYQHSLSDNNYLQFDGGLIGFGAYGAQVVGTYNWVFARPNWTNYGSWE